jgi:hypothetical protein
MKSDLSTNLRDEFADFEQAVCTYFEIAGSEVGPEHPISRFSHLGRTHYWDMISPQTRALAADLEKRLLALAGKIIEATRKSPLLSEADHRDVVTGTKAIRAALHLGSFQEWTTEILHDEGQVLGVRPPGQSEDHPSAPSSAWSSFSDSARKFRGILDLVVASQELTERGGDVSFADTARYRPGTAFIIMAIDKTRPELNDVVDAVKEIFERFGVHAIRADEIEHEGKITSRILQEIETSEFLFADLTGERPNVYYEVGYAHALKRRVILFRKEGTGLHFDLADYNCPGYENLRDLKEKLTKRLQNVMNKSPRTS